MTKEDFAKYLNWFHTSYPHVLTEPGQIDFAYSRLKNIDAENFGGGIEMLCDELDEWPYNGNFIAITKGYAERYADEQDYKMTPEEYARQRAYIDEQEKKRRGEVSS